MKLFTKCHSEALDIRHTVYIAVGLVKKVSLNYKIGHLYCAKYNTMPRLIRTHSKKMARKR